MTMKRTPRPRDPIQLGKLMVDIAAGQVPDAVDDGKDEDASVRGRAGGLKGGVSRAAVLDPQRRTEIAKKSASVRWSKKI